MTRLSPRRIWAAGEAAALHGARRLRGPDLLVALGLAGALLGVVDLGSRWTGAYVPAAEIDLSPLALPRYALYSLMRGLVAFALSLGFALGYGALAAKDRIAERLLVPALDVLQSIPVLGFMPGFVLALAALFPRSNFGLELAAILMIFTGQVWNLAFSFFQSLRSVPADKLEAATVFRFSAWQRFRWVELPSATIGLVWNAMISVAGGWFFLMISESFRLGTRDFRLPGIGSYMSVAVEQGNGSAMLAAIAAMILLIVALDQFLWRPVVVWSQRFRLEETSPGPEATSWFLDFLRRSLILSGLARAAATLRGRFAPAPRRPGPPPAEREARPGASRILVVSAIGAALIFGLYRLAQLVAGIPGRDWGTLGLDGLRTLGRVLWSVVLGTLWTLPLGIAIGRSPRLSRLLQPAVQIAASFPAPMLFPLVVAALAAAGVPLGAVSIALMLLGTQWYILFNVIAGAMAVPADLVEASTAYGIRGLRRLSTLLLPAVFPYLVTGWVTAAGGAWNASIVSEYVTLRGETRAVDGLGARISEAAAGGDFHRLGAGILIMAAIVVLFNQTVWRWCYRLAANRFSLSK